MARAISKNQVSDPGPSWPSCSILYGLRFVVWETDKYIYTFMPLFGLKLSTEILKVKHSQASTGNAFGFVNSLPSNKILDWSKLKA